MTPLADSYAYIADRYRGRTDGVLTPAQGQFANVMPPSYHYALRDQINGEPIALTTIVMSSDPAADRSKPPYIALRQVNATQLGEPFQIRHTDPSQVDRIMAHADTLFARATNPFTPSNDALRLVAEIHWWLANAMPDHRGSAAKSEFAARAIAEARGSELPPFRAGFVPDLEAMTTRREDFVAKYLSAMEWKSASISLA